jgi:hypothetical protein
MKWEEIRQRYPDQWLLVETSHEELNITERRWPGIRNAR